MRMPGAQGTLSPQAAPRQGPAALVSSLTCLFSSSYFSLSAREQWKGYEAPSNRAAKASKLISLNWDRAGP